MYPHERSLVQRMESSGRPFALIGVNSDANRDELKKVLVDEKITWRSFWDRSTTGPIATRWSVHAWPTIYVIDPKGVIRYRDVRGEELDNAVNTLLREMEEKK
jgi:hypothetical protein